VDTDILSFSLLSRERGKVRSLDLWYDDLFDYFRVR
jgi:hypothetical protein